MGFAENRFKQNNYELIAIFWKLKIEICSSRHS